MLDQAFSSFTDITVYFVLAMVGTGLFAIRVVLMLVFGGHSGGDFDLHVDAGGDVAGHEAGGFSLFSMLSMMSFMMGAGWMGLLGRTEWGLSSFPAAAAASAFGFALMFFTSLCLLAMRKFQQEGKYNLRSAIGKTGRVYLTIPPKGEGSGQVEITVDGRRSVVPAVSVAGKIESFSTVRITDVRDDGVLIVEAS